MLKNLKNKKKKGFTLVELVVVIAIIAILAAVLVPQISSYIEESRKTEVIQEAREISTAVESVEAKTGVDFTASTTTLGTSTGGANTLTGNAAFANLVDVTTISTIPSTTKLADIENLLKADEYTFSIKKKTGTGAKGYELDKVTPITAAGV